VLKKPNVVSIVLLILFSSCNSQEEKDISTYTVTRTNFENTLTVDGFTEPVHSSNASCPPQIEGVVAYLIEDGTQVEKGDTVCIVEAQVKTIEMETSIARLDSLQLKYSPASQDRIKETELMRTTLYDFQNNRETK
jgi:multidrug efflux pump subunit AcrA (membrane-fusion protein)